MNAHLESSNENSPPKSAGGYLWVYAAIDEEVALKLSKTLSISPQLARLLVARGITSKQEAQSFLRADLSLILDPHLIDGIDRAVKRLKEAIEKREKIVIFGDYDVDGITSTALAMRVLFDLNAKVDFYIPSRFKDGYGLSKESLKRLKDEGASLILTVDNGISALSEIDYANEIGLSVIITDHHEPGASLPNAFAVINPKSGALDHPLRDLAGVGVVFKLLQALTNDLASGYEIFNHLDLVALGTIADMVPLRGENRVLAKNGLLELAKTEKPGLIALMQVASLKPGSLSAEDAAYFLAPRLNAAGRMADGEECVKLLLSKDLDESIELARRLDAQNNERRSVEEGIMAEALAMTEGLDLDEEMVIVLSSSTWHEGVKGIVASRLANHFHRPTFLLTIKDGLGVGSGRSIPSFNLFEALSGCTDILESFGGHAGAAGLKVKEDLIEGFRQRINKIAKERIAPADLIPKLTIDLTIDYQDISENLLSELDMLSPFGMGNRSPSFYLGGVIVQDANFVGGDKKHLSFKVHPNSGAPRASGPLISGISFNHKEKFGRQDALSPRERELICRIVKNDWNGGSCPRLYLIDYSPEEGGRDSFIEELFLRSKEALEEDPYRNITDCNSFFTKVVGVTFEGRQDVISGLSSDHKIVLTRDHGNPFDPSAIRVEGSCGCQLGFLKAGISKHLAPLIDSGALYEAKITEITGGDKKNLGVNILVKRETKKSLSDGALFGFDPFELGDLTQNELTKRLTEILLEGRKLFSKQLEVLDELNSGRNTLAIMGTGRGKSVIFHIFAAAQAIGQGKISIILYPLRSLINDQYNYLQEEFSKIGLGVVRLSGDIDFEEREAIFSALSSSSAHIVLTTPEFLHHNLDKFRAISKRIGFFVIDEAHHVSTSSELHRPLYPKLNVMASSLGNPLVLALTATAGDKVASEIIETLGVKSLVIDPFIRKNLMIIDKRGIKKKDDYIKDFLSCEGETGKSIIYVNSREQSVRIASFLRESLPQVRDEIAYYNAGLDAVTRHEIESRFKAGEISTIVSTSAFGEGVNIPDIKDIFIYHMPFSFIEYNQESGRAGRDGKRAAIHLLFGEDDAKINRFILESMAPSRKSLIDLYLALRNLASATGSSEASNKDILSELEVVGKGRLNESGIYAGLKIFEEIGLIEIGGRGQSRVVNFKSQPGKLSLSDSVRFEEGRDEKDLFAHFKDWVMQSGDDELLSKINQPIYPKDLLKSD